MNTQPGFQVEGVGRMGELCFAFYKESVFAEADKKHLLLSVYF